MADDLVVGNESSCIAEGVYRNVSGRLRKVGVLKVQEALASAEYLLLQDGCDAF
jgi:hypothetical protein